MFCEWVEGRQPITRRKVRTSTHISSLARLVEGDNSCLFSVWFRSWHRDYETTGDGSGQADWNVRRSSLVRETAACLEQRGDDVYLELRNGFEATGSRSGARIVGRPDIIVRHTDGSVTVYDVRSGEPGATDEALVKLHMYLLPRSNHGLWRRARPDGCVLYDDGTERRIAAAEIDGEFRERVTEVMRQIAADQPARHVPSTGECGRCVLTADDCSERLDVESDSSGGDRPGGLPTSC